MAITASTTESNANGCGRAQREPSSGDQYPSGAERAGSPRGYRLPEDRLDDPPVEDPRYSAYTQFIGLTQHDAYHAGQIVLLKRAVQAERRRAAHDA
jgi:hypothetical protein